MVFLSIELKCKDSTRAVVLIHKMPTAPHGRHSIRRFALLEKNFPARLRTCTIRKMPGANDLSHGWEKPEEKSPPQGRSQSEPSAGVFSCWNLLMKLR
jgi:hypothetical protein